MCFEDHINYVVNVDVSCRVSEFHNVGAALPYDRSPQFDLTGGREAHWIH